MNCEEAENLISARVDGELRTGDPASIELDAHLVGCAACRATAEAVQVQDAALVRAFAPARRSAEAVAERVAASSREDVHPRRRWAFGLVASACVAAGAAAAVVAVAVGPRFRQASPVSSAAPPPAAEAPSLPVAVSDIGETSACSTHLPDASLVLQRRDDPMLAARVGELLSRVAQESEPASVTRPACTTPGPVERMVRAQGTPWCEPLARHVRSPASQADRASRVTAARLLADLATQATIGDLIALTGDADGEVRAHATTALQRLTGQQLGASPMACATDSPEAVKRTHKAWQDWWAQNRSRYGAE